MFGVADGRETRTARAECVGAGLIVRFVEKPCGVLQLDYLVSQVNGGRSAELLVSSSLEATVHRRMSTPCLCFGPASDYALHLHVVPPPLPRTFHLNL